MKFAQLFILVLAFFMVKPAQAGLLVEPVLGYTMGKFESDDGADSKFTGPSFGGRLGYQNLGFQIGLDYLQSNLDLDEKGFKDMSMQEFAGFVGFEFPVLLRVYAGYIFSANAESKFEGEKVKLTDGSGMKLGLGLTALPFLDINFEYRKGTFSEFKVGGSKFDVDSDYSAYMIGISLPFVL